VIFGSIYITQFWMFYSIYNKTRLNKEFNQNLSNNIKIEKK